MRHVASAVGAVIVVLAGCSSEAGDPCPIAGTYTMMAVAETNTCPTSSGGGSTAVTITARPPGKTGPDFYLEIQGTTGGCAADKVDVCKIQSKCNVTVTDALSATDNVGTLQFSWTFDGKGFTGLNSGAVPPAESVPKGCSFTSNATGIRR